MTPSDSASRCPVSASHPAVDFVTHFHPEEFSYSFGGEPGLTGPTLLRFEFDAALDEPINRDFPPD